MFLDHRSIIPAQEKIDFIAIIVEAAIYSSGRTVNIITFRNAALILADIYGVFEAS